MAACKLCPATVSFQLDPWSKDTLQTSNTRTFQQTHSIIDTDRQSDRWRVRRLGRQAGTQTLVENL